MAQAALAPQHSAQVGQVPPELSGKEWRCREPLETSAGKTPLAWLEVSLCLETLLLGRCAAWSQGLVSVEQPPLLCCQTIYFGHFVSFWPYFLMVDVCL